MSALPPGLQSAPPMRIKFVKLLDLSEKEATAAKQSGVAEVSTGREVVTDKFISSAGISPCLGILMSDGEKTYFRHHSPGMEDRVLKDKLTAGLKQLDGKKSIQGLVIGGQDVPETQELISRITKFFNKNKVKYSVLAPHNDRGFYKVTNLLFNPKKQKLIVTNDDSSSYSYLPDYSRPLLRQPSDVDQFYKTKSLADSARLEFSVPSESKST